MKQIETQRIVPYNDNQIIWHLENNIFENLTDKTIKGILKTIHDLEKGKISLDSPIHKHTNVTVGEMLEDLKLLS